MYAAQEGGECVRGVDLCGVTLRGAPGQPAQGKAGSVENRGRAEEQQQNVGLLIGESLHLNFLFHNKQGKSEPSPCSLSTNPGAALPLLPCWFCHCGVTPCVQVCMAGPQSWCSFPGLPGGLTWCICTSAARHF